MLSSLSLLNKIGRISAEISSIFPLIFSYNSFCLLNSLANSSFDKVSLMAIIPSMRGLLTGELTLFLFIVASNPAHVSFSV